MLKRLFPKVHARYAASANGALLGDFAVWLVSAGYARDAAHGHVRRLKQALERMSSAPLARDAGISAGFVSQAFASLQAAPFQGTRRAFERFLAAHGQLLKEFDPNRFAPLLDRYRRYLLEVRGLAVSTADQHIATIKRFLAQALSADAPLQDLSALAVERFLAAEGRRMRRQSLQHVVASVPFFASASSRSRCRNGSTRSTRHASTGVSCRLGR